MPSIHLEELANRLSQGKPVAAVVLRGTDSYLREVSRDKVVDAVVPGGARDWAITRLSAREAGWDEILERAQTLPMLVPRQVLIVEDAESLEKLGEKSRDAILRSLEAYLSSPAPFTVLLLEASGLDERQKYYKVLQEKAYIVELKIDGASAVALAEQIAKNLGARIDRDAAMFLAEILNGEAARIRIELEKLATYTQDRGHICKADIEALVVAARKNTVWQLADMLARGQRAAALAFLDNLLREGEEPIGIVGALAWMYRKLIEARGLPVGTPAYRAARALSMHPEAAQNAIQQAYRIPRPELLAGLIALAEADSQLKSSVPNPRALMEFLVARLTVRTAQ